MPNHAVFAACVDLTILSAAAGQIVDQRTWKLNADELYRSFAPVVRIEILVLYFFVVFHKLNSGFFDREHSCGAFMYLRLAQEYPFLPSETGYVPWAIYLTILTEAVIPIMLVAQRLPAGGFAAGVRLSFRAGDGSRRCRLQFFGGADGAVFSVSARRFLTSGSPSTLAPLRRAWLHPPNRLVWFVSRACCLRVDAGAVRLPHFSAGDRDRPDARGVSRRLGRVRCGS